MTTFNPNKFTAVERTQWFEWDHGVEVLLRFVRKPEFEAAIRRLTPTRGAAALRGVTADVARRALVSLAIKDWRGATLGLFKELAGFAISDDQLNNPLDPNEQNYVMACKFWPGFEDFVTTVSMDAHAFTGETAEEEEERQGNSETGQSGGTTPNA